MRFSVRIVESAEFDAWLEERLAEQTEEGA
jgi:heme/copper-type cytochrome/quinol oxidase subunit 2